MHAEIIAIGTELTNGSKLDTNSQWLSNELGAIGIPVHFHTTVADKLSEMVDVLRIATIRSDLVVITGGLGPTQDDLTRQALADLTGCQLVLHESSLEQIRALFAFRRGPMPERNRIQAFFPAGSEAIPNAHGTAPGIWMEIPRDGLETTCTIAALPGVPSEMKRMFHDWVLKRLPRSDLIIRRARVHCFGAGESAIEEMLGDVMTRGRDPEVGITAHEGTITLRIVAHGTSESECQDKIHRTRAVIGDRLGNLVFGEEDDAELEQAVVRLLRQHRLTVATVETYTGGLMAQRVTEVDGFATCFAGGYVMATDGAQSPILPSGNVSDTAINASAGQSVAELAEDCRRHFQADFGLATGVEPESSSAENRDAATTTLVALAAEGVRQRRESVLVGNSAIFKILTAKRAWNLLRLHLLSNSQ